MHVDLGEISFLLLISIAAIRADVLLMHILRVAEAIAAQRIPAVAAVQLRGSRALDRGRRLMARPRRGQMAHPIVEREIGT